MLKFLRASLAVATLVATANAVSAAALQVAPTTAEVPAGVGATTIMLKNPGTEPLRAQVRVFKWSIVNGEQKLEPTKDVVVSPPMMSIKPGADYTVRLVRLSKAPVNVEENYRVLVNEIAEPTKRIGGTVALAFQYSIPVFFMPAGNQLGDLKWSYERRDGKLWVNAVNTGGRRVRIADLLAAEGKSKPFTVAKGLAGYVLAKSSMSWVAPGQLQNAAQPLLISAQTEAGPINAQALPQPPR